MHFLIDASMPRSTASVLKGHGHEATDVRDIGLGSAADEEIASYAQANGLCLLSRDFDFADIRNYPPEQYSGIVIFEMPATTTAAIILKLVEAFLQQTQTLGDLPGRLAIVEIGRTRLRPSP